MPDTSYTLSSDVPGTSTVQQTTSASGEADFGHLLLPAGTSATTVTFTTTGGGQTIASGPLPVAMPQLEVEFGGPSGQSGPWQPSLALIGYAPGEQVTINYSTYVAGPTSITIPTFLPRRRRRNAATHRPAAAGRGVAAHDRCHRPLRALGPDHGHCARHPTRSRSDRPGHQHRRVGRAVVVLHALVAGHGQCRVRTALRRHHGRPDRAKRLAACDDLVGDVFDNSVGPYALTMQTDGNLVLRDLADGRADLVNGNLRHRVGQHGALARDRKTRSCTPRRA